MARRGSRSTPAMLWVIGSESHWELAEIAGTGPDATRLKRVDMGKPHLDMSARRQGIGAGTPTGIICRAELEAGRLVELPLTGLPVGTYAVVLPSPPGRPVVEAFADWLATIF